MNLKPYVFSIEEERSAWTTDHTTCTHFPTRDTILIVDDIVENMTVLHRFLTNAGFRVLIAQDGKSCIDTVEHARPDLVLLDIMMPVMNGFQVCEILKNQLHTKEIPIIFMTALADTSDKVNGFRLGAADYITKPFQQAEVLARINAHLNLYKLKRQLQKTNEELDAFAHTVAHDLKNPLAAVSSLTDLLMCEYKNTGQISQRSAERMNLISRSVNKAFNIIDALLLLAGVSRGKVVSFEPLDMKIVVDNALLRLHHLTQEAVIEVPQQWFSSVGYAPWVEEIWVNYLSNALKYGGNPAYIQLGSEKVNDGTTIKYWVKDNGAGIPDEEQNQLFTPFTRLQTGRIDGHGLGLSIVQQIAEKLHGDVGVESQQGKGSLFYFTLPALG